MPNTNSDLVAEGKCFGHPDKLTTLPKMTVSVQIEAEDIQAIKDTGKTCDAKTVPVLKQGDAKRTLTTAEQTRSCSGELDFQSDFDWAEIIKWITYDADYSDWKVGQCDALPGGDHGWQYGNRKPGERGPLTDKKYVYWSQRECLASLVGHNLAVEKCQLGTGSGHSITCSDGTTRSLGSSEVVACLHELIEEGNDPEFFWCPR
jgi:hypothetical protein